MSPALLGRVGCERDELLFDDEDVRLSEGRRANETDLLGRDDFDASQEQGECLKVN